MLCTNKEQRKKKNISPEQSKNTITPTRYLSILKIIKKNLNLPTTTAQYAIEELSSPLPAKHLSPVFAKTQVVESDSTVGISDKISLIPR
jgi:hypothetical protein